MAPNEISACRLCGNPNLEPVLSLGEQPLSSVFPSPQQSDPSVSPLELLRCDNIGNPKSCGLLQLRHQANNLEMYGKSYGYYSSISPTMVSHLREKVRLIKETVVLQADDIVLDIGCNDGTLLNEYGEGNGFVRVGIDPSSEKFASSFHPDIQIVFDFFSEEKVRKIIGEKLCKVITSIAMFYDLEDPLGFMQQVESLLASDGIWVLELSYLPLLCTQLTYDQICHEHLTYFGLSQIVWMTQKTGLHVIDVSFNDINGGSFSIIIAKKNSPLAVNCLNINSILDYEKQMNAEAPYLRLHNRVLAHREEVLHFFELAKAAGKKVYGYGASTKGNIVLNYCGLSTNEIIAIGDRNPEKSGLCTPGSRIPIIAHREVPKNAADYLFVLIWHFRKEVITDELDYILNGGKLVFDLPRLHIIDKTNYRRYLEADFTDLAFSL